jgi:hypothetical protein
LVFGPNGTVEVREIGKAEEEEELLKHSESVHAWARHGDLFAAGTGDGKVLLWDTKAGELRRTFSGHARAVLSVTFDPQGKRLASGGEDTTIKVWDLERGKEEETLYGHGGWVLSVVFSPDGKTLASGGFDGMVRIWPMADQEWRQEVIRKGLDYLKGVQRPEGFWKAKGEISSKGWQDAVVTGLGGLAFLSSGSTIQEGSYQDQVCKTRDWLLAWFDEAFDEPFFEKRDVTACAPDAVCFGVYFLGQLYKEEPTPQIRKTLEEAHRWLLSQQEPDGGWSYGARGGMPYLTNWVVPALVLNRSLGLDVPQGIWEKIRAFYTELQNEDGGYRYHGPPCYDGKEGCPDYVWDRHVPSDVGRSVGALWAMHLLGMEDTATYRKTLAYARENWRTIASAKHGPGWSLLFCGMGLQMVSPELFDDMLIHLAPLPGVSPRESRVKRGFSEGQGGLKWISMFDDFLGFYVPYVLGGRHPDGRIMPDPPRQANYPLDAHGGVDYATAVYVHFLNLPERPLLLHRLDPVK